MYLVVGIDMLALISVSGESVCERQSWKWLGYSGATFGDVGSYLCCSQTIYIEPPHGESAFVCITPERLCRVEGGHVETEAVAGTWKPSEITNNDEVRFYSPR